MGLSMDGINFCVFLAARKSFNVNPQEPRHVSMSTPQGCCCTIDIVLPELNPRMVLFSTDF